MSKAYIQLDDNIIFEEIIPKNRILETIDDMNTIDNQKSRLLKLLIISLVFGVFIFFMYWWRNTNVSESFDPDDPSNRDSFPARVDSNLTMNKAGRCNSSLRSNRSNRSNFKNEKRLQKKHRVRWSDPLIRVMEN